MKRIIFRVLLLSVFTVLVSCNPTVKVEINSADKPVVSEYVIDQEAVEILRSSLDFLSKLEQFSVQVQSTLEDIHVTGHRIDVEMASSILISRPDKLRTERHSEEFNQIFYYNGSELVLYNPVQKVYASEPAPGSIDEMIHHARDRYGLSTPASDLIYDNAFELLMDEVQHAEILGLVIIGDVTCIHLLFSRPGVDFQIWIAENGPPLPYKYVVIDTSTPELLGFSSVMRNWNINPEVSDQMFNFEPGSGEYKIEFLTDN